MTKSATQGVILDTAFDIAKAKGLSKVYRRDVAKISKFAEGTINLHFNTMDELRDAVVTKAIEEKELTIISDALVNKHPLSANMPLELKREALNSLV
jgi:AcrR family transcriptional regulator